ncbi:GNAT family N-acetyltransferase [Streptomyces otsuchiensis]|uniref:GNAT family N-acetyltransferase n=1 Tax=Streptomyces otsuchiensis TaxID=2681388 RepID=UPI00102FAE74|nr:GNAT family N-acetyltransferase [Streptomyces otsuchiensis]
MATTLTTDRLLLRPVRDSDLETAYAINNDPEVMRYLNGGRPVPLERVRDKDLPRMTRHHPAIGGPAYWAAEERATGRLLGWLLLRPVREGDGSLLELGYRLGRDAWGRGLATEGSRALIRYAFTELGAERVTANTMTVNAGSRRVMEKCGLRLLRTYFDKWPQDIEGSEHGDVEYVLDRADWTDPTGRTDPTDEPDRPTG